MADVLPWVKWRFDRWRNDEGLRMCGLAARGLWVDLLAIMHGCEPYGHLAIKGRAPSSAQIASMVGMTNPKEVSGLLVELEEAGVFSREESGLIFCRRMVRDNLARLQGKLHGCEGGNPVLTGRVPKPITDEPTPNAQEGLTPPVKTEKREEKRERVREEKKESRSLRSLVELPGLNSGLFPEFWAIYPRKKEGPKVAEKAWIAAIKRGAEPADIVTGVRRYEFSPDPQFIPQAVTWLNQSRWTSQPDSAPIAVARTRDNHRNGAERMIDDYGLDVLTPMKEQFPNAANRSSPGHDVADQARAFDGQCVDLESEDWTERDGAGG